jgi:hypothetical protein
MNAIDWLLLLINESGDKGFSREKLHRGVFLINNRIAHQNLQCDFYNYSLYNIDSKNLLIDRGIYDLAAIGSIYLRREIGLGWTACIASQTGRARSAEILAGLPREVIFSIKSISELLLNLPDEYLLFSSHSNNTCPCKSGKLAKDCCLDTEAMFRPRPASTHPPMPRTGLTKNGCYAGGLADCDSKLTAEHYISESVLTAISQIPLGNNAFTPTQPLSASGLPWSKGEIRSLMPSAFKAKILCERHNNALSSLDSMAQKLWKWFNIIHLSDLDLNNTEVADNLLINGHDLEMWMLKTLCGIHAAKLTKDLADLSPTWSPPAWWINVLFGREAMPSRCGLYFHMEVGESGRIFRGIGRRYLIKYNQIAGFCISIYGFQFYLLLSSDAADGAEVLGFRPLRIAVERRGVKSSLWMYWDSCGSNNTFELKLEN